MLFDEHLKALLDQCRERSSEESCDSVHLLKVNIDEDHQIKGSFVGLACMGRVIY